MITHQQAPCETYRFTLQACAERRIEPALYGEALSAFGEVGLVNLIQLIGIYLYIALTLNVFEVPIPPGRSSRIGPAAI
jgi:4-carboxymuconolactone decarboxylase